VEDWKECGTGEIHMNELKSANNKLTARLVMRAEKTKRLILNAPITENTVHKSEEKTLRMALPDLDGKITMFALRFKSKPELSEFVDKFTALAKPKK